jgi:hypothetical protein
MSYSYSAWPLATKSPVIGADWYIVPDCSRRPVGDPIGAFIESISQLASGTANLVAWEARVV